MSGQKRDDADRLLTRLASGEDNLDDKTDVIVDILRLVQQRETAMAAEIETIKRIAEQNAFTLSEHQVELESLDRKALADVITSLFGNEAIGYMGLMARLDRVQRMQLYAIVALSLHTLGLLILGVMILFTQGA